MDTDAARSAKQRAVSKYPEPFVVPSKLQHKQSIVILHGRFTSGEIFAPKLLGQDVIGKHTLPDIFPHARFIFPTASDRNACLYGNAAVRQWFDNWFLEEPLEREDLSVQGLRESSFFIHDLVEREAAVVGEGNVIIGGMSQGCAAMYVSLLNWDKKVIPLAFGMCGWLPFCQRMLDAQHASDQHNDQQRAQDAIIHLQKTLNLPSIKTSSMAYQNIPIFHGHGQEDDKVFFELGQEAISGLQALGAQVEFVAYPRLKHWFSREMLVDIVNFIKSRTDW